MPPEAIAAALISALIHAGWNAALKAGRDRLVDLGQMAVGGCAIGVVMIAVAGAPRVESWPYIAASCAVHFVYWTALSRGYAAGDMSHVYTIARGSAPALVTIGALLAAREMPAPATLAGITLVSIGIFAVGFSPKASWRATGWAALTGVSIATYSLIDALGARVAGDVLAYKGIGAIGTFLPILLFALARRGPRQFAMIGQGRWAAGAFAGAISIVGFGIVLWAQQRAPIGPVTALRETSVVFGALIAAFVLKEHVAPRRWLGAGLVAAGVGAIALVR